MWKHPYFIVWAQTDSNRRPSACKADALNQLSYAPERIAVILFRGGRRRIRTADPLLVRQML